MPFTHKRKGLSYWKCNRVDFSIIKNDKDRKERSGYFSLLFTVRTYDKLQ